MGIVFKNNAKTTLASSLSNSATSATVTDGSVFPTLGAGEFFLITFDDGTNNEICKCTARSSNTLTIVRAQDNTSARSFSSGDAAEGRVTAGVLETIQENIAAKSADQTVYNATTASSATAYNIGIDPGVEANAMVFLDGVMQHHDTFSFSGSTLTFDAAPVDGTKLEVIVDNLINLQSSNLTVDSFTAADVGGSAQTAFTLSDTPAAETNLIVFVEGVFQDQDAYTISSNTLTITTGVIAGRGVTVYVINPVNIGTPSDGTITSAKLSGNLTLPGTLTVGANDVAFDSPTFVVDNSNSRVGLGTASPTVPVDIVGETKMSSHLTILDAGSLKVGTGADLVISSDGTDGTIATLSSLTIDVAGSIILDADGGQISFKDGGTEIGVLENSSSDFAIESKVQDKDIKFVGNDNGSAVTALTLDMSEAGAATFNSGATFGGVIQPPSANAIDLGTNGTEFRTLYLDTSLIASNELTISTGTNLVIDAAGAIKLDAGGGEVQFKDDGTEIGVISMLNSNMNIESKVADKDIIFKGIDGSSDVTAMTIDMSEGGRVGIGTTSPSSKLHMESGNAHNKFSITSTASGGTGYDAVIDLLGSASNSEVQLNMGINGDADREQIKTYQSAMTFRTNNADRWVIESGGKFYGTGQIQGGTVIMGGTTLAYGGVNYSAIGTNSTSASIGVFRDFSSSYPTLLFNTSDDAHFAPHDADMRVYLGSQGGDFGGNSSNNLRPVGTSFFLNSGGANFVFERAGTGVGYVDAGGFNDGSDEALKKDIADLTYGLDTVKSLKPRKFKWKSNSENSIGFIAQEVESIIPEVVGESNASGTPTSFKGLSYGHLTAVLTKAIQEQQVLIEALQKEVEELKGG